ncbi:hypothetical protein [Occallatibacter riparius]|uniref:Uncharacterized protein n=1 Tax=Occallatibacter riparius TaxID=1002689 RepID=A0A9J7BRM2_9BACT|nr:hypothetical protein [Occallatibacter riparius]UWZ84418.1 hypothetical protein MOP44_00440 [Occallatibacter riparius]
MGVAQAMPADKYGFGPAAGTFAASQGVKVDGARTFAMFSRAKVWSIQIAMA